MKSELSGKIIGVQPRIYLNRANDEIQHSYLGFCLLIKHQNKVVRVGISDKLNQKWKPIKGMVFRCLAEEVKKQTKDPVDYYKVSEFEILDSVNKEESSKTPPYSIATPLIKEYQTKGYRRLDPAVFDKDCTSCIWASQQGDTEETFCYGPLDCIIYRPGRQRFVLNYYGDETSIDFNDTNTFVGKRSEDEKRKAKQYEKSIRTIAEIKARLVTLQIKKSEWLQNLIKGRALVSEREIRITKISTTEGDMNWEEFLVKSKNTEEDVLRFFEEEILSMLEYFPELIKNYSGKENLKRQSAKLFPPVGKMSWDIVLHDSGEEE